MLKIETIEGDAQIEANGSATELILEWMKLTQGLAEKLGEVTGTNVTLEMMVSSGMQLLDKEQK